MYKELSSVFDKKNDKSFIYFDAACTYLKYKKSLAGISRYYEEYSCCSGDRESSLLGSQLLSEVSEVRKNTLRFLRAKTTDVCIFTSSATDGINRVVRGIDITHIKHIVVTDIEHNSNFLPQYELSKEKNIAFTVLEHTCLQDMKSLEQSLKRIDSPFLFCCTQTSNITGETFDIQRIASLVHKYGGYILVDATQYIPSHSEEFSAFGIDFLVFSAHKIGGPTGIGCLIIKEATVELLKNRNRLGGGTVKNIKNFTPTYKSNYAYFEGGVQDFGGILGLGSCIRQIEEIGYETITPYIESLRNYFITCFYEKGQDVNFSLVSSLQGTLITLHPKKFQAQDFHQYTNYFYDKANIIFRTGTFCADNYVGNYVHNSNLMRLSYGIYNTKEEIDIFFDALDSYVKSL